MRLIVKAVPRAPLAALLCLMALLSGPPEASAALPAIGPEAAVSRPGPIERGSDDDAKGLLGTAAPGWPELRWLDGRERDLQSLDGRAILIRSFTNDCPFCAATMPALERLHREYEGRGLTVLGVYHPKPPRPTASEDVAGFVRSLGVTFPVAVDEDWDLVKRWWTERSGGDWTSITWVLDGRRTIRHVHPGGEYHEGGGPAHERCRRDLDDLTRIVRALLAVK